MVKTTNNVDNDEKSDVKANREHIGYFSASMMNFDAKEIYRLLHSLKTHAVWMRKSNDDPADDWWFFLLPRGSTKTRKAHQGDVPRYTVRLPDGYSFTLEMADMTREKFFPTPPLIFLDETKESQ